jgi:hypothetical protein
MLNLYTGNAVQGTDGSAAVALPDWFTALNDTGRSHRGGRQLKCERFHAIGLNEACEFGFPTFPDDLGRAETLRDHVAHDVLRTIQSEIPLG